MSDAPPDSILLLEDVDAMFVQREQGIKTNKITFSGFLNALDGVRSQEGQILFMTTNHKEKLDPALLRPGRADVHVKLENASEKQMIGLFQRFFPEAKEEEARKFSDQLPVHKLSMAKLQGHFLKYRENKEKVIEHARELLDDTAAAQSDMTVAEWLHRTNLSNLNEKFQKQAFYRVSDFKMIEDGNQLMDYEITTEQKDIRRFWALLSGEKEARESFQYLSKHGIRQIARAYFDEEKKIKALEDQVPEKTLTGFQLRDILEETNSSAKIRKAIVEQVLKNNEFNRSQGIKKEPSLVDGKVVEQEDDGNSLKEKREKLADFDLRAFFEDLGAPEIINALQKEDLFDPLLFFEVEAGTIDGKLECKPKGKHIKVKEAVEKVREKYKKDGKVSYSKAGLLEEDSEAPALMSMRSVAYKVKDTSAL